MASGSGHRGNEAAAGDGGGTGAAEDETRAAAPRAMHVNLKKGDARALVESGWTG